jgi:hypothetical protein
MKSDKIKRIVFTVLAVVVGLICAHWWLLIFLSINLGRPIQIGWIVGAAVSWLLGWYCFRRLYKMRPPPSAMPEEERLRPARRIFWIALPFVAITFVISDAQLCSQHGFWGALSGIVAMGLLCYMVFSRWRKGPNWPWTKRTHES